MTLRNKQYLTQGDFSKKGREPSDHLKMPECLYDCVFLFLRRLRRPAVLTLRRRHIHLVHVDLHADVILCLRKFGQKTYRLDVGRDNAVNVDTTREQIYPLGMRKHINPIHLVMMILCCNEWMQSAKQSISSVHLHISDQHFSQVFLLITGRINLFTQSFFVTKFIVKI